MNEQVQLRGVCPIVAPPELKYVLLLIVQAQALEHLQGDDTELEVCS